MASIKAFPKRPLTPLELGSLAGWLDLIPRLIKSDVYTPTLTDVTNLDGSTAYQCQYMRVGDVVHVSGKFAANPTAGAPTATELGISLPIPSNFSAEEQCGGSAANRTVNQSASIQADATNNRAAVVWSAVHADNRTYTFHFMYRIIN